MLAFGWDSDMSHFGPNAHLASAVIYWGPYYKKAIRDVLDGTWRKDSAWWGLKEGAIDIISISDKVPAETKSELERLKAGLRDGSFHPWTGPIVDQSGKELLAAGVTADDVLLHKVDFYVKGVEGKVPGK